MEKVLELYKEEGETPLETIERFKKENPVYKDEKMTYAGRLDPMAQGVLLVLVGEECKNKDKYLGLGKEYEFEILWGFKTDTYDILGIPKFHSNSVTVDSTVTGLLEDLVGKFNQKYPPYSSMTVEGKQLFQWAREGRLDEIKIPEREVEVYDIEFLGQREVNGKDLLNNIKERISKVKGDFRQNQILEEWEKILSKNREVHFPILKVKIKCSSGTYVRGIANELGEKIGVSSLAFSIKRTGILSFY
ncbi:hypothetical protein KKC45_04130 [Patescibacteria group bacterium]|nr:hypothetical protein [Patescibacteria group bacterium]